MKCAASFLLLGAMASVGYSEEDYEVALKLAEKNRLTLNRIHNYGCNPSLNITDMVSSDQSKQYHGTYYASQSAEKFLLKTDENNGVTIFQTDKVLRRLSFRTATGHLAKTLGKPVPKGETYFTGTIEEARATLSFMCNVSERAVFRFYHPDYSNTNTDLPQVTLEDVLKHPKRKFEYVKRSDDGNEIIVLSARGENGTLFFDQFTLSPRMNYLITSFATFKDSISPENLVLTREPSHFLSVGNAIYFPQTLTEELRIKGRIRRTEVMILENLVVNSSEAAAELSFEFPKDIEVSDHVAKLVYQTGPGGTLTEIGKYTPPQYPPDSNNPGGQTRYPVGEESMFSWPLAFGGLSGLFFLVAAVIWAKRAVGK